MVTSNYRSVSIRIVLALVLMAGSIAAHTNAAASSISFGWAKVIGGIGADAGYRLASDENGNIYFTGQFQDTVDFDPGSGINSLTSQGGIDIFVSKFDSSGNNLWTKSMGGILDDYGYDIALDASGNIYLTGGFSGIVDFDAGTGTNNLSSSGERDIFVTKLDNSGNFVWAKSVGGTSTDFGNSIVLDGGGNVYISGFFNESVDFDPGAGVTNLVSAGSSDSFILKLSSNGNFVWAKRIGGISSDSTSNLDLDQYGNLYVTGGFTDTVDFDPGVNTSNLTSTGERDVFIAKLDGNGGFIWSKGIGGTLSENAKDSALDGSGNIYVTGEFRGSADFDPGIGTNNLISTGLRDIFIGKFDNNGDLIWVKGFGGIDHEFIEGLVIDGNEDVYLTGEFGDTVDFDPGTGISNMTSAGWKDIFVTKFEANGNFAWAKSMGGASFETGHDIGWDKNKGLIVLGELYNGSGDFDPGPGVTNLTSAGENDIFITKLVTVPQTFYVKWNANGANNGTSWTNAYTNLQSALAASSSGDEIWVAAGTYKPIAGTDRTISFALKNGVALYGGFAGTETLRTQRNPVTNVTVLSGDIGVAGSTADNSYHVVYSESTDDTTMLDGFTITAGNANGSSPLNNGGGLYNKNSSLKLENLIFQGNTASVDGGGLYNTGSNSTLLNITFRQNTATNSGGGIYNSQSDLIQQNITFDQNSAGRSGGGMANYYSHPTLTNVTFYNNSAATYGGGLAQSFSSPTLINVTFNGNSASVTGGGAITNDDSHPVIVNSILYGNVGGEIRNFTGSSPQVAYSIVQGGHAGTGNLNLDPLLGSLANNGGFTQTMALGAGSPAIDAGTNTNCPSMDQRGVSRPQGSHCDMGAYEAKGSIAISIAGAEINTFPLAPSESKRVSFPGVNNGPVKIMNSEALSLIAAERLIYKVNGVATSFTEMMGLPDSQLDNTYWLPWYNNVDLDTQLRFANVSSSPATVTITIGTQQMGDPIQLAAGASTRISFAGVNNGPVKIVSTQNIVAAERLIYKVNGKNTSFSEMMALPNKMLDTTYWLPWYNNVDLDTQLRFANVSSAPAQVHVYIGGVEMQGSPFNLLAGESTRKSFPGINNGPVEIVSDQDIVAAERLIYKVNNINTSFTEMMALPNSQLDTTYWLPWYNNKDLDTQLRFANVHDAQTATVHVLIGGVELPNSPFTLLPGESTRKSFAGVNNGPVQVVSNVPIVAAERLIYKVGGVATSFSEMMALPESLLDTTYWLPWYNNVDLDTQLRFGIP